MESVFDDKPANLFNGIFDNIPAAFFSSDQPIQRHLIILKGLNTKENTNQFDPYRLKQPEHNKIETSEECKILTVG
jgi:hypothetical protein